MTPHPKTLRFFVLVFVLSAPFWLYGAWLDRAILPGLPASAGMAICPALAGCWLIMRSDGANALKAFLRRTIDCRKMRPWAWLVALGTMPLVMILSGLFQLAIGIDLPPAVINPGQTLALFALFFIAATTEELGWSGYAAAPLVRAHGLIVAGLMIGLVSVLWHLIPLLQIGRSWDWIAWWALGTLARRKILLWLFIRGCGSVFSASLFHAMSNLSWMLFPVMGSHFDPMSAAIIQTVLATVVLGHSARGRRAGDAG